MLQNNQQKLCTRKELVMMEKTIYNFDTSLYIPENHKLACHIPHVQILGKNYCGESLQTAFKRCESFQDVLCSNDYAEGVLASFAHQTKS